LSIQILPTNHLSKNAPRNVVYVLAGNRVSLPILQGDMSLEFLPRTIISGSGFGRPTTLFDIGIGSFVP